MKTPVELVELSSGTFVEGTLFDDVSLAHFIETQRKWRPLVEQATLVMFANGTPKDALPRHWHWNWEHKEHQLGAFGITFFGIEIAGELQGIMKIDLAKYTARIPAQKGLEVAYIDYLEAAPWNIREIANALGQTPKYAPIGTRLFEAAVRLSQEVSYEGRVALHSLPLARTEQFYEQTCKMTSVERDAHKENLLYFETTPEQAESFLAGAKK